MKITMIMAMISRPASTLKYLVRCSRNSTGTISDYPILENPIPEYPQPELDDIKTEFHPHSGLPTKIEHFGDYKGQTTSAPIPPRDKSPWLPFRSRADFELAEIALKAALNKDLTNALIDLIHRCIREKESFTLRNHSDISELWQLASIKVTKVSQLSSYRVAC
jgi:hypothetical protein